MADPDTVWLAADTKFAADVTIGPNVRFGPGVSVGAGTEIKAFCDIEGARIGRDVIIGPFARIRPGSEVADEVHIGNFVELKATRMGRGAKANHLAYLGDSDIGAASNIGAGTIAVNYDGYGKWRTVVGADAFVGSNSSLVAPVRIGRGANVTAGSVITEDVPAGAVAFGRARQVDKEGAGGAASCETEGPCGGSQAGQEEITLGRPSPLGRSPMCGIIGIIGKAPVTPLLVEALKRLEYRGYDSAGVATLVNGHIDRRRAEGKLVNLEARLGSRAAGGHDRHRPHALGDPRQAQSSATRIPSPPTAWRSCTTASSRTSRS